MSDYNNFYDEDVEDEDEDEDEKFLAVLEYIRDLEEEYYSTPRKFILDINRVNEFKESIILIARYFNKIDPKSKINCEGFNNNEIPVKKNGSINIEMENILIDNIQNFLDIIKNTSTISIVPLIGNKIRIFFDFSDLLKEIPD